MATYFKLWFAKLSYSCISRCRDIFSVCAGHLPFVSAGLLSTPFPFCSLQADPCGLHPPSSQPSGIQLDSAHRRYLLAAGGRWKKKPGYLSPSFLSALLRVGCVSSIKDKTHIACSSPIAPGFRF